MTTLLLDFYIYSAMKMNNKGMHARCQVNLFPCTIITINCLLCSEKHLIVSELRLEGQISCYATITGFCFANDVMWVS